MKRSAVLLVCILLLVGIVSLSCAQPTDQGLKDRSELMGAAAWVKASADGHELKGTILGVNYGKFVTRETEVQLATIYANVDAGGTMSALVLAPGVAYHFLPTEGTTATVPYIGAGAAFARIKGEGDSDNSMKLQYFAGAKFFIGGDYSTANKAVFVEYRHTNVNLFDEDVKLDLIWAGLSCFF